MITRRETCSLFAFAFLGATEAAWAEDFPSRPIRILVPAAPGGAADISARLAAEALGRALGSPVIVENRRSSLSAIEAYVGSEPDGYTILVGAVGWFTIIPAAKHVSYDVEKDFVPLGTIWRSAEVLAVGPRSHSTTLAEFIADAKARPATVTVGSAGNGTISHLTFELLKREAAIDAIHVPFRSTGESLSALLGGQIDAMFADVQVIASQVTATKCRALAVAAPQRVEALPDVPTMSEAGLPAVVGESWFGYFVSAKTPAAVVKRLQDALAAAHDDAAYQANLARQHASAGEAGPEALDRLVRADIARWRELIKAAGIRLDQT
ncbi:MAG TPA: tripartite tricarboxylate transporter substrate binding protein [Xanthobacteraceae bacterium]|nr:tripartite tricarboxylate transporter substrate binding protein [Xanthobacteraceae bacterium]